MKDLQKMLDVGHTKSYALVNGGHIKTVRIGSHRKVVVASIYDYVGRLMGSANAA